MRRMGLVAALAVFTSWGTLLTGRSAAAHPASGIAVDSRGTVYFADTGRGVWRVDGPGRLTLISTSAMHWMAFDREGRFADAPDDFGEWFGRLTPRGQRPTLISCSDFPCAVGPDGNLYYAKMHGLTIVRRTPDGRESVLTTREKFGVGENQPVGVNGIACGRDGTVYLVSLENVRGYEGSGDHALWAVAPDGSARAVARNFVRDKLPPDQRHPEVRPEYCRGLAVDAQRNVYVAVPGNRCVMRLSPDGTAAVVLKSEKPWTPTGVDAFDGEVYVLEYDDETPTEGRNWPPRVRKVGRDGKVTTVATGTRAGGPAPGLQ